MPSSVYSDDSDASTIYSERVSKEEAAIVLDTIKNLPKKWKPSSAQVVIGIVHSETFKLLSGKLRQEYSGFFGRLKSEFISHLPTLHGQSTGKLLQ